MRCRIIPIIICILIIAPVMRAQFIPKKNNYYITLAQTKKVIVNDTNTDPKSEAKPDTKDDSKTGGKICAPKTCCKTQTAVKKDTAADPKGEKQFLPRETIIFVYSIDKNNVYFRITDISDNYSPGKLNKTELYSIPVTEFTEQYFRFRAGFTGGLLNAPFKYRPDKQKIYPGGNLAYYGSWLFNVAGFEVKPLLFAGLTTITTTDVNTAKGDAVSKAGFTTGLGFALEVFEAFDLGIIAGWDFIDPDWESNGRVWFAVSFNFKL